MFNRIFQTSMIRNVWRAWARLCMLMFGLKRLIYCQSFGLVLTRLIACSVPSGGAELFFIVLLGKKPTKSVLLHLISFKMSFNTSFQVVYSFPKLLVLKHQDKLRGYHIYLWYVTEGEGNNKWSIVSLTFRPWALMSSSDQLSSDHTMSGMWY